MDGLAKIEREELVRRMREDFEKTMREVADAVNAAPDGHLIDGSEERCREVLVEFGRRSFQAAAQMRVEATEVSVAFSPGTAGVGQPGAGGSVAAQLQRGGGTSAAAVRASGRRDRHGH
jgi:hypothetical protein